MTLQVQHPERTRLCFREPVPEIADAARYLDEAVSAHLAGRTDLAEQLIQRADMPAIREWTESIWGGKSPYKQSRFVLDAPPVFSKDERETRKPTSSQQKLLLLRDGYHCRFCGIPLIRAEIRKRIREFYPRALVWGKPNIEQHAAFQAMWVQYDHVLPHSRGGSSDIENLVITCGPCNFGRMESTLEEVGLIDPRTREPVRSAWDGLERFK